MSSMKNICQLCHENESACGAIDPSEICIGHFHRSLDICQSCQYDLVHQIRELLGEMAQDTIKDLEIHQHTHCLECHTESRLALCDTCFHHIASLRDHASS